jgi:hypothetical protein
MYTDVDDLIARATRAYFRRTGPGAFQPNAAENFVQEIDGKQYVVLCTINRYLAVYEVSNNGKLSYLDVEWWPEGIVSPAVVEALEQSLSTRPNRANR